jgi:hypothetical protein
VASGRSCQAAKFSIIVQDCQPKPSGAGTPASFRTRAAAITSSQVVGISRSFSSNSVTLTHITGVEELKGSDSMLPSVSE